MARLAASLMKSGMLKSGSPRLRPMMSLPWLCNSLVLAAMAKVADTDIFWIRSDRCVLIGVPVLVVLKGRVLAQFLQMSEVRNYGFSGGFVLVIGQIELLCRLFHNFGNVCVVDVADVGEIMMFHLVVEPPGKPVDQFVLGAKVHRGEQLVDGPGVLHIARLIGKGGFRMVHDMGQLEDH